MATWCAPGGWTVCTTQPPAEDFMPVMDAAEEPIPPLEPISDDEDEDLQQQWL